jgi:YfiH family protein
VNGFVTYHFDRLTAEGLVHAVFTRLGGVSVEPFATLNVGHTVGDDLAAVAENHSRIYARLDLNADCVVTPRQVHSNRVAMVSTAHAGQVVPNTDGLATNAVGVALLLRFADCQPIMLYDPANHALALIHAGWRGVAQGIARRAVERMQGAFDTRPQDLIAGLGPAIGPCCYTVGHNVASAMGYALHDWNRVMSLEEEMWRFDLPAANAQQLESAGVRHIEQAHLCTACHTDEFFSHRAEGGRTGRFGVMALLTARARDEESERLETPQGEREQAGRASPRSLHPPGFPAFQEMPGREQ